MASNHAATDGLQEMVDTSFEFYKRLMEEGGFFKFFLDWLFEIARDAAKE